MELGVSYKYSLVNAGKEWQTNHHPPSPAHETWWYQILVFALQNVVILTVILPTCRDRQ